MQAQYLELVEQVNYLNILKAQSVVYQQLKKTHMIHYTNLSELIGAEVFIKHENHNPTGSFKVRGAVNFMSNLSQEIKDSGIIVATRGNHGFAMCWAAKQLNVLANVVVPVNNNPEINKTIIALGGQLMEHGEDFYEAQQYCEDVADQLGYYYARQGNEPHLLNGLGTLGTEIFEDLPDVEVIFMPIGGGSGCASLALVAKTINPKVKIIGVQAEKAPAFYKSWHEGKRVITDKANTFADGLAARSVFEVPYLILKDKIDDVILVSEEEIMEAVRIALSYTHNLAEGAGVASLAGAIKIKDEIKGKQAVIVMTGANLDRDHLELALNLKSNI